MRDGVPLAALRIVRQSKSRSNSAFWQICFAAGFFYFTGSPAAAGTPMQARTAADFCNSLGINVHVAEPSGNLAVEVAYLGFHHVRDGVNDAAAADADGRTGNFAKLGINWDFIVRNNPWDYLRFLVRNKARIALLEGPNEPDLENPNYGGLRGIAAARLIQQDLYGMVMSSKDLRGVPVLNYAIGHPNFLNQQMVLPYDYDIRNVHVYAPVGRPPRNRLQTAINPPRDAAGLPVIVSETGYTTVAYNIVSASQGLEGVDEPTQAKYLLDTVFDDFVFGVAQTYIYDLKDDGDDPQNTNREDHFGLFHYDGTPKMAARAFHNLAAILADRGPLAASLQPGKLALQISGGPGILSVLLQKSDGSNYLVVWTEPKIWDAMRHMPAAQVPSLAVNVRFDTAHDLAVFDPLLGTNAVSSVHDVAVEDLKLIDHPLIIQIKSAAMTIRDKS